MKDITPEKYRRTISASCPSIHVSDDGKTYHIVGKLIYHTQDREEARVEIAVEIINEAVRNLTRT